MALLRDQLAIALPDMGAAIGSFEPAHREMPASDALEMIHEDDVDSGSADCTKHWQRAGSNLVGDDEPEARDDLADEAGHDGRGGIDGAALEHKGRDVVGIF